MAPVASLTAQAAGLTHLARQTLQKESQAGSMREESISMKFHPSQKTYAGLSTGTSSSASTFPTKMHRPKKKRSRDEREMGNHMAMGNEGVYHSSFDKSDCETGGTNIAGISRTNGIKEPPQLGGKYEAYRTLNSFSHKVKWSKGRKGAIQIYPRMGDVWALYKNWSSDWNAHTPDEVIHKYVMVEVLEDFNEQRGVAVAPLVKVPGFKTVFQKHSEACKPWIIPREELFRFSHQVPSYVLTGQEGQNAPQGCMELDPAAAPLELLQVLTEAQIKEMEVIPGRAQEETVLGDMKVSKEKDLLENDQKVKPNVSKGGVAEAVMGEEIKEEKENKKPVKFVYKRCRRRKQEC
ncbi:hypothetical protein CCACVL1_10990 [Corchorus capsularis]|uniref:DUF3444 domain-containing protein n=1 Tax=Corchorus capsularis TaxID=210143 RepID=A0A1R3INF8_COCAP|nr:hypothetical protein CCACVL1_10990 [Corchorus capsularis]